MTNFKNSKEIMDLENEFQNKLIGHYKPTQNSNWKPYNEFITKIKQNKPLNKIHDKIIKQFEKDLIKEQKKEQKEIIKDIKKLSKELNMEKMYKNIKQINKAVKFSNTYHRVVKKEKDVVAFYEKKYSLKLIEKSSYKMKNLLGELFNYEPNIYMNTNMETVNVISNAIFHNYLKIQKQFKHQYKQGFKTVVKMTFMDAQKQDHKNLFSVTVRNDEITPETIKLTIKKYVIDRFIGNDSEFDALFNSVTYYVFSLSAKGGCASCEKIIEKLKYKDRTIKLISPKSTNDNCLFMCFIHCLNIKGNKVKCETVRKSLKLTGKIKFDDVHKVAKYFDTGYVLLNQKQEIISQSKLETKPKVHIMLMNEHYFIVEYIDYKKCQQCGKKLLSDNETHECSNKMTTYWKSRICNKREFVDMIDCSDKIKISEDSMIFFDLETFQETICHVPYACGFSYGNHKKFDISYG